MKVSKYVSRIRKLGKALPNEEKYRFQSHVVLMSPGEYDLIFNAVLGKDDAKGKFLIIAKMIAIKMPYIAKRKFQIMKWQDYLSMWKRYELKFNKLTKERKEKAATQRAMMAPPQVKV